MKSKNAKKHQATREHIRRLRLTSRRLIHAFGEGTFRTLFHGRGIEFASLREYVPGDDIRQIDWNTTARRGTPYVKTFLEERDLSVVLVIDLSSSMQIKMDSAIQLVSLLTTLADVHEDRLGCLGFSDRVEFFVPPTKSPLQPDRILHLLLAPRKRIRKTSIGPALTFLRNVLKKHALIFLISDFLDRNFERSLLALRPKHELVGIHLYEPIEKDLPESVVIECYDPESGNRFLLDAYDFSTRSSYKKFAREQETLVQSAFGKAHADLLMLASSPYAERQLIDFLMRRQNSRVAIQFTAPLHSGPSTALPGKYI
jgi:uncharacterized protein (DUF58 family)